MRFKQLIITIFSLAAVCGLARCAAAPARPGVFRCPGGTRPKEDKVQLRIWCVDSQEVRDGPYRILYPNGGLAAEGLLKGGQLHGRSTGWHPNGQKAYVHHYRRGKPHGRWVDWFATSNPQLERTFDNGKVSGPFKRWHKTGDLAVEATYREGQAEGLWTSYYPNGVKASQGAFTAGREEGDWRYWYANKKLAARGRYRGAVKVAKWNFFDSTGGRSLVWTPPKQRRAGGQPCEVKEDCLSGVCEGGCHPGQGRCAEEERNCLDADQQYLACDGTTFMAAGLCPGERTLIDKETPDKLHAWRLDRLQDPY